MGTPCHIFINKSARLRGTKHDVQSLNSHPGPSCSQAWAHDHQSMPPPLAAPVVLGLLNVETTNAGREKTKRDDRIKFKPCKGGLHTCEESKQTAKSSGHLFGRAVAESLIS